ncbi:MAG: cyclic nucleotide-binding domain-containing protein, partial [Pseudomonadota bacterium]
MCSNFEMQMSDPESIGMDMLRQLQPFAALDSQRLHELAPLCRREPLERGTDPSRQEKWRGHSIYLVKGELNLTFADGSTIVLVGGSGEAAHPIGKFGLAPVSTKAITDIELLVVEEDLLDIMLTWDQLALYKKTPGQAGGIREGEENGGANSTDWRKMSGLFAAHNLTRGIFAALPPAHIDQLLQRFRRIDVRRGDKVVLQGETGDYYYLIETGRCQVTRMVGGASMALADLQPGDAFGEEAL